MSPMGAEEDAIEALQAPPLNGDGGAGEAERAKPSGDEPSALGTDTTQPLDMTGVPQDTEVELPPGGLGAEDPTLLMEAPGHEPGEPETELIEEAGGQLDEGSQEADEPDAGEAESERSVADPFETAFAGTEAPDPLETIDLDFAPDPTVSPTAETEAAPDPLETVEVNLEPDPLVTPPEMSQMLFVDVVVSLPATHPVVVLQEADPPYRELRIPVGGAEGIAIAYAARGNPTPRPLTHELFAKVLEEFGMNLDVVRITTVRGTAFTAEMVISGRLGARLIDCRPSDAIALALRQRLPVPIMASPIVLTRAGTDPAGAN